MSNYYSIIEFKNYRIKQIARRLSVYYFGSNFKRESDDPLVFLKQPAKQIEQFGHPIRDDIS